MRIKKGKKILPRLEEMEVTEIDQGENKGVLREKATFQVIFLSLAVLLIFLPFITTFNEFLTKIVEKFYVYTVIQDYVVPYLSRLVGVLILPFGFHVMATNSGLFLAEKSLFIDIAWNCVGWQSLILIIITLVAGLQGQYTRFSKGQVILIGLLGTFLFNILRITSVVLFAVYFGYFPAVIFHDYFSNLLIVLWLFFFWWFSYAYVLMVVQPENPSFGRKGDSAGNKQGFIRRQINQIKEKIKPAFFRKKKVNLKQRKKKIK